jgi:hypothetical protein
MSMNKAPCPPRLTTQETGLARAVAEQIGVQWQQADDDSVHRAQPCLRVGTKQIGVDPARVKRLMDASTFKLGLRLDKVAVRLVSSVRTAVEKSLPKGTVVVFTVTAPIRVPSKTAAELESTIRKQLSQTASTCDWHGVIHGNQVRICLLHFTPMPTARVIGYVHNPDSETAILLELTRLFLDLISGLK